MLLSSMTRSGSHSLKGISVDVPSHTTTLLGGLSHLRSNGLLLDVTLSAEGEHFQAHRLLLAACSDYFRAMFTDEMRERQQQHIELHAVSAVGLHSVLTYIYTGVLSLDLSTIQDVLSAAAHLQLPAVQEACAIYLQNQLDLENCVDVASIAETYSLCQLRTRAYAAMCSQLREFSSTAEFQRLSSSQLVQLLRSDHPVNCSEGEVATAVARWLSHCPSRSAHARHLLYHINWSEVPQQVLHSLALPCPLPHNPDPQLHPQPPKGLLNTRGLELAFVKVGGFSISGITNEITYRLSPSQGWHHLTTIPHVEQCNFGTAVLDNQLYVVGGCFNQSLQENIHPFGFRYSPQTDKWSTISPMLRERCRFTLTVLGEKLYAVGGEAEDGADASMECEMYKPGSDSWHQLSSHPANSRAQHSAVALDGKLFVLGGIDLAHDFSLSSCWVLNTSSGSWSSIADMIMPRADHSSFVYAGEIYVCGGWNEDETGNNRRLVSTLECYNPSSDSWRVVTSIPTPRYHAGIVVIGDGMFVMGGFHSDATFDRASGIIECYDLEREEWHSEKAYPRDIWEHTCVALHVPRCREDVEVMISVA
uniref:Kelch-like protein diablo n=3 Tax=Hirondellea gigas TaxID=1518452 RepID=A0A6A7G162_9CRUS